MKTHLLYYCPFAAGGSWIFDSTGDEEAALRRLRNLMKADWGRYLKFKRGTVVKVNIYDVAEIPNGQEVRMDDHGVTSGGKTLPPLKQVETRF